MALLTISIFSNAVAEETLKLDTDKRKYSYIAGVEVARQLQGGSTEVDLEAFTQAVRDVFSGAPLKMSREQELAFLGERKQKMAEKLALKAEQNRKAEETFLAANRHKRGVVELPSGIQYQVLKAGDGGHPNPSDKVTVHYRGTLLNGKEFDSSYQRGEPASFRLDQVIKGWRKILPLMQTGAKWTTVIPASLAYGSRGMGGVIGPDAALIFEIELLEIN